MTDATHERFLASLDESVSAVQSVASWLVRRGWSVRVPGLRKAPRRADWREYSDGGDLFIEQRVEVKRLSVAFSSTGDWPFGEKFIVCSRHSWERASPKPMGYIVLSCCGGHLAWVDGKTSSEWYVESRVDSRYGEEQEFLLCPLGRVVFSALEQ